MDLIGLANGEALLARLDRFPQARAVIWGHIHQPFEAMRNGVRLLGTSSTSRQFTPGTEEPVPIDEPPAWRWLELYPDGAVETDLEWVAGMVPPQDFAIA